jgi:hypothetical protein
MVDFGGPPPEVEGALRRAGQTSSGPPPPIQGIAPGVGSLGGLPDWVRKGLDEQRRAREEEERREAERRAARERAEQAARERAAFEQLAAAERRAREAAAARQAEARRAAEREAAQQAARERAQQAERERAAFEQLAAAERRAREAAAARQVEAQRAAEREAAQRRAQQADQEQVAFAELSKSEREARLKAMLNAPIQAIPSATGSLHDPNPQPRPQPRQVTPEPRWSPTAAEEQWYEQVLAQDAQAARSDAPSVAAAYYTQQQLMQEAEDRSRQAYRGGPSAYRALQREEQLMQQAAEHGEWAGFDRPARTSASSEPVELGLGPRRGPPEEVVAYRTVAYDLTAEDLGGEEGPIDDSFETISKAWGRLNDIKTRGLAGEPDLTFGVIPGAPAYELFTHRLTVTQLLEADGTVRSFVTQRPLNEEAGWSLDAGRYDAKRTGGTSQVLYSHYDVEGRSPFATSYADVAVTVTDPGDGDLPRFEQNVKWHGVLRPEIRESADWWSRPSFSVIEGLAGKEIPDWLPDPLSPVSPLTKWGIEQVYDFDVEKSGGLSARGEVVEVGPWVLLPDRSQP